MHWYNIHTLQSVSLSFFIFNRPMWEIHTKKYGDTLTVHYGCELFFGAFWISMNFTNNRKPIFGWGSTTTFTNSANIFTCQKIARANIFRTIIFIWIQLLRMCLIFEIVSYKIELPSETICNSCISISSISYTTQNMLVPCIVWFALK